MSERHFVEGTTHVTYLHKNDERRSKFHCKHLRIGNSCPFRGKCIGSAHCFYYEEKEQNPSLNKCTNRPLAPTNMVHPFSGTKELPIKDIIIDDKYLKSTPNPQKIQKLLDYYKEHQQLNAPIQVICAKDKYRLKDKYIRYYVAKQLGLTTIPAIYYVKPLPVFGQGARVVHKKYGVGSVTQSDSLHIHITFDSGVEKDFEKRICAEQNLLTLYKNTK